MSQVCNYVVIVLFTLIKPVWYLFTYATAIDDFIHKLDGDVYNTTARSWLLH